MDDGFTVVQQRRPAFAPAAKPMVQSPHANIYAATGPLARDVGRGSDVGVFVSECINALLPFVKQATQPVLTKSFTASSAFVLMPHLRRLAPTYDDLRFKSQWGQVIPFLVPLLASKKGIKGSYDPHTKSTNLVIDVPGGPPPVTLAASRADSSAQQAADSAADHGTAAVASATGWGIPQPATGLSVPRSPAKQGPASNGTAGGGTAGRWCVFCGAADHLMGTCPQFRGMLQSVYAAGVAAGRQQPEPGAGAGAGPASSAGNDWGALTQRAMASMQQVAVGQPAGTQPATGLPPPAAPPANEASEMCMLCGRQPPTSLVIPCAHSACPLCAKALEDALASAGGTAACPLCSAEVECLL